MPSIDQSKLLIIATDGYEKSELETPLNDLRRQGATVDVAAPAKTLEEGSISAWNGSTAYWDGSVPVDLSLDNVDIADYDALIIPGGVMNPDKLRREPKAIDIVKKFIASGKPVAAICHGPWLLVEADAVRGRQVTSFSSIKTDVINAGGDWVDEAVVADQGIITSRAPRDLSAFIEKIVEEVEEGRHADRARTNLKIRELH